MEKLEDIEMITAMKAYELTRKTVLQDIADYIHDINDKIKEVIEEGEFYIRPHFAIPKDGVIDVLKSNGYDIKILRGESNGEVMIEVSWIHAAS
jgi:hypothetical protein